MTAFEPPPGTTEAKVEAAWRSARPALALLMIFAAAAMLLGPLVLWLLVVRGLREGRPSWVALGVVCGLPLVLIAISTLRRLLSAAKTPSPPPAPPPSDPPRH